MDLKEKDREKNIKYLEEQLKELPEGEKIKLSNETKINIKKSMKKIHSMNKEELQILKYNIELHAEKVIKNCAISAFLIFCVMCLTNKFLPETIQLILIACFGISVIYPFGDPLLLSTERVQEIEEVLKKKEQEENQEKTIVKEAEKTTYTEIMSNEEIPVIETTKTKEKKK